MISYTRDIKLFRMPNTKLVLADTPGFDNTDRRKLKDSIIRKKITTLVEEYVVLHYSQLIHVFTAH